MGTYFKIDGNNFQELLLPRHYVDGATPLHWPTWPRTVAAGSVETAQIKRGPEPRRTGALWTERTAPSRDRWRIGDPTIATIGGVEWKAAGIHSAAAPLRCSGDGDLTLSIHLYQGQSIRAIIHSLFIRLWLLLRIEHDCPLQKQRR